MIFQCTIKSDFSHFAQLGLELDKLREHLPRTDASDTLLVQVHLALHEALTNIAKHAYKGEPGKITYKVRLSQKQLQIDIYDSAEGFAFSQYNALTTFAADDPPEGGYGLAILTRVMDVVEYERVAKRGNHWRLIRKLTRS